MADDPSQRQLLQLAAERLLAETSRRAASATHAGAGAAVGCGGGGAASSNYDYVKIKVRLGAHLEHYYILSRFLLSRMLTVITLPQHKAVRVALDVKKHLVDHGRLDITQEELEEVLFALLRQRGYGDEYVRRYQMVTRFFQQKRPLIILVAGSACTGKSSLAQQLASRLNLPNVLQTDVLYELLRASGLGDLPAEPLWRRPLGPGCTLLGEFQRECGAIRRALDGDLHKCIRDGKSIIVEGLHIDPGLFLGEFGDPRGDPVLMRPVCSKELPQVEAAEGQAGSAAAAGEAGSAAAAGEAGSATAAADGVREQSGVQALPPAALETAQQLERLEMDEGGGSPAHADGAAPATSGAADAVAYHADGAEPGGGPLEQQQRDSLQAGQQQERGSQAAAAARVRRSASYSDAVPGLSYTMLHHQESPWKDASTSKPLLRPRSARVAGRVEQRQAVFMLQSTEGSGDVPAGAGEPTASMAAPAPVPTPRLAACISLPTVMEDGSAVADGDGSSPGSRHNSRVASLPASPLWQHSAAGSERSGGEAGATLGIASPVAPEGDASEDLANAAVVGQAQQTQQAAEQEADQQAQQQAQHSSVGAAYVSAAGAAGTGPVFVPICLAVPDEEYEGMLHNWLAMQQRALAHVRASDNDASFEGGASGAGGGTSVPPGEAISRLRELQAHLRQYTASGVPLIELNTSEMGRALDSVHAYVLQCIALAMGEVDYQ